MKSFRLPRRLLGGAFFFALFFSVGLALPALAEVTLFQREVKLMRSENSPRIFATIAGMKHIIRTPLILESYAYRDKAIQTVAQSTLDALEDVRLVKSSAGPRVYLLAIHDQKVWYPTEESFLGSGEVWSDIVNISQYDSRSYRNGVLVKVEESPVVFYLNYDAVTRAPFSTAEDFVASGFSWGDIVTVQKPLLEGYRLVEPVKPQEVKPVVPVPVTIGGITVTSANPAVKTFPAGTIQNQVFGFILKAGTGGSEVNAITVTRTGLIADQQVADVLLSDSTGLVLTRPQQFASGKALFQLSPAIVLSENQEKQFYVSLGISPSFSASMSTVGVAIVNPTDIQTRAAVSGTFPITSPQHTVIGGTTAVGQLTVDSLEISSSIREIIVGTSDHVLNKFEFSSPSTAENIVLNSLTFTFIGGQATDFSNFEIIDGSSRVVAASLSSVGTTVTATFGATGYVIPKGERKTLQLRADVVSGENRTVQITIQNDYDIRARGSLLGFAVKAVAGPFEAGSFPVGDRTGTFFNAVKIVPGQVTAVVSTATPKGTVIKGAVDTILASYEVRSLGPVVRLERIVVSVAGSGPSTKLTGVLKLRQKGGAVLASVDGASVTGSEQTFNLSPSLEIKSGVTVTLEVVGSISDLATSLDSYTVMLRNFEMSVPTSGTRIVLSASLISPVRPVQELGVVVRQDPAFKGGAAIAGKTGVKVGRIYIRAGAGEKITIDSVTLATEGATAVTFSNGYSNLKLGGKLIAAPTGSSFVFPLNTSIGALSEAGYDILVDTTTAVAGDVVQFRVVDVAARGGTSSARVGVSIAEPLTPATVFSETTLSASLDGTFVGGAVTRSSTTILGSFLLTATGAEEVSTTNIVLRQTSGAAVSISRGYKSLRLVNATNGNISTVIASPIGGSIGDTLGSGPTLKPGVPMIVKIAIDARTAPVGETAQFVLADIQAKGKTSGVSISVTGLPITGQTVSY